MNTNEQPGTSRPRLVVVGNGMAGVRAIEELQAIAPDRYEITVFGAEPHPNYNRILLSPVLSGEKTFEQIVLNDADWYRRNGVRLHLGKKVATIDREARFVVAADGTVEAYDRLIVATGSSPFILPLPGTGLEGVLAYRDIEDTRTMITAARTGRHAVVIGGGLLGLEAAAGLRARGMEVVVVHAAAWLMERQVDRAAASLLQESLEARGIGFRLGAQTEALLGMRRVLAVRLAGGEELPADLVVMAVGVRPNTALAEAAGLRCERGILVDDGLVTSDPLIQAVGECASHRGVCYGLVAPAIEMARVCAQRLAGNSRATYEGSQVSTKLKVTGVDVYSAGHFAETGTCDHIVLTDPGAGVYRKLVIRDDLLVGAVLYGDTAHAAWYLKLMREGARIDPIRDRLMFGELALAA
jgi:nitrite reductase (NADH) large subunit